MNDGQSDPFIASHAEPAWRDRADFIIVADISESQDKVEREQLWARQIADYRFEICCIPFFAYDLALGDEVETDENYLIKQVARSSGRFVFRVWFESESTPLHREKVVDAVRKFGCTIEWPSQHLLAIDAPAADAAKKVADYLHARQTAGYLTYETGRTR